MLVISVFVVIIVGVVSSLSYLAGSVWHVLYPDKSRPEEIPAANQDSAQSAPAVKNAIVVADQRLGSSVAISKVSLEKPGYVVVYGKDVNGKSGSLLGVSALLPAGENNNVVIPLSRPTKEGDKLSTLLHAETNSDTYFTETDTLVQNADKTPVISRFTISSSAP